MNPLRPILVWSTLLIWPVLLSGQETAEQRRDKLQSARSEIEVPEGFELRDIKLQFDWLNVYKRSIPGVIWTGDALLDYRVQGSVIGNWEEDSPEKASDRVLKLKLVLDLQYYCTLYQYLNKFKNFDEAMKSTPPAEVRKVLGIIGDMRVKTFDTVVLKLQLDLPKEIEEDEEIKIKPAWHYLPHAFIDKKEESIYRLVARPDKEKRIKTTQPGYLFTYGRTQAEKTAELLQEVVALTTNLGLINSELKKPLGDLIRYWIFPGPENRGSR